MLLYSRIINLWWVEKFEKISYRIEIQIGVDPRLSIIVSNKRLIIPRLVCKWKNFRSIFHIFLVIEKYFISFEKFQIFLPEITQNSHLIPLASLENVMMMIEFLILIYFCWKFDVFCCCNQRNGKFYALFWLSMKVYDKKNNIFSSLGYELTLKNHDIWLVLFLDDLKQKWHDLNVSRHL